MNERDKVLHQNLLRFNWGVMYGGEIMKYHVLTLELYLLPGS